ncbi:CRISPR-associated helicase Cas3' [bacterium]|nr:CRISPR-associated helicase Cas3' [bacterium]
MKKVFAKNDGTELYKHLVACLKVYKEFKQALPKLPEVTQTDNFFELLFCSVFMHDWGKCHFEFQKVLNKEKNCWQNQRHEAYSVPFVWKLNFTEEENFLIACAVLGHHKDFKTLKEKFKTKEELEQDFKDTWQKHSFHPEDFTENFKKKKLDFEYLKFLENKFQALYQNYCQGSKIFEFKTLSIQEIKHPFEFIAKEVYKTNFCPSNKNYWQNLLLQGSTKICDHLGSALIKKIHKLEVSNFEFLKQNFYEHQKKCLETQGNAILIAPTGSGKTESALLWLKTQLQEGQGRTFYVLPFTASINAMHQRLLSNFENEKKIETAEKIGVQHGKLSQYLASFYEDQNYEEQKIKELRELHRKMIYPLKVVTPFQILKWLYGVKGFEMGFTELCGAFLIFDEIHAYDEITFAQILVSIEHLTKFLKVKVLVMTATLPTFMVEELKKSLKVQNLIRTETQFLESFNRHKVKILNGNIFEQSSEIKKFIKDGKKVIVVCNSVVNAQKIFKELKDTCNATLLHGRFNSFDRFKKEEELQNETNQLLIGTQAIEVSLDIDYDVLFTEPAPLDALIQRFGRVNRKRKKGICEVFVCTDGGKFDSKIYPTQVVKNTLKVLERVDLLKEAELQKLLDEVYPNWTEEQKSEFEDTKTGFLEAVKRLQPYSKNPENEEEFEEKFKGIQVLPEQFLKEYKESIEEGNFIEAEKFLVTLQNVFYFYCKNENLIDKNFFAFEKMDKLLKFSILVVKCKYSSELGLLKERFEGNEVEFL